MFLNSSGWIVGRVVGWIGGRVVGWIGGRVVGWIVAVGV